MGEHDGTRVRMAYLLDRNGRFVTHFKHDAKAEAIANAVGRLL